MNDTSSEIECIITDRMKRLSGEERLRIGASMFDTAKRLVIASFARGEAAANTRVRLFLRFYGGDFDSVSREKIITYINRVTME